MGAARRSARMKARIVRAMPWIFVLIWSTGFIVARFGMPHAPPLKFLALRFALSLACFVVWVLVARVQWPREPVQWWHLAVVGVLMAVGTIVVSDVRRTDPAKAVVRSALIAK